MYSGNTDVSGERDGGGIVYLKKEGETDYSASPSATISSSTRIRS